MGDDLSSRLELAELERQWAARRSEISRQLDEAVRDAMAAVLDAAGTARRTMEDQASALLEQLRAHCDRLAAEVQELEARRAGLAAELAKARQQAEADAVEMHERAAAEAAELRARALAEASEVRDAAAAEASHVHEHAVAEAAELRGGAAAEASALVGNAEQRRTELSAEIDSLEQRLAEAGAGIQSLLHEPPRAASVEIPEVRAAELTPAATTPPVAPSAPEIVEAAGAGLSHAERAGLTRAHEPPSRPAQEPSPRPTPTAPVAAPAPQTRVSAPGPRAPMPRPVAAPATQHQRAAASAIATTRTEVTISQIPGFARALEIQRGIQRLAGVRLVQAHQFEREAGRLVLVVEHDSAISLSAALDAADSLPLTIAAETDAGLELQFVGS